MTKQISKLTNKQQQSVIAFLAVFILISGLTSIIYLLPSNQAKINATKNPTVTFEELEGQLVSDFPDFPTLPNSALKESYKQTQNDQAGFGAEWLIYNQTVYQTSQQLVDLLSQNGWQITHSPQGGESVIEDYLTAHKHGKTAHIFVEYEDEPNNPVEISVEIPYVVHD